MQSSYNTVQKHDIHDTHNTHNTRHTMPDLNNLLTVYNTAQKIQYSNTVNTTHNTYTDNIIQQTKNTIQHKTHVGLNALAVVQTQSTTYTARCTSNSSNKMCDLQHIRHEDTMQYLHTTE